MRIRKTPPPPHVSDSRIRDACPSRSSAGVVAPAAPARCASQRGRPAAASPCSQGLRLGLPPTHVPPSPISPLFVKDPQGRSIKKPHTHTHTSSPKKIEGKVQRTEKRSPKRIPTPVGHTEWGPLPNKTVFVRGLRGTCFHKAQNQNTILCYSLTVVRVRRRREFLNTSNHRTQTIAEPGHKNMTFLRYRNKPLLPPPPQHHKVAFYLAFHNSPSTSGTLVS